MSFSWDRSCISARRRVDWVSMRLKSGVDERRRRVEWTIQSGDRLYVEQGGDQRLRGGKTQGMVENHRWARAGGVGGSRSRGHASHQRGPTALQTLLRVGGTCLGLMQTPENAARGVVDAVNRTFDESSTTCPHVYGPNGALLGDSMWMRDARVRRLVAASSNE